MPYPGVLGCREPSGVHGGDAGGREQQPAGGGLRSISPGFSSDFCLETQAAGARTEFSSVAR